MRKNILYSIFIILFFTICLVPSLGLFVFGEAEASANEILAARPGVFRADGSLNIEIADDISDYMAERFALRKEMITAYAGINAAVFGESSEDSVVYGTDGWLFYRPTVNDYLHIPSLTERSAYGAGRTLAMMQEYAARRNVKMIFTVAPNKNSLYTEHMSDAGHIRNDKKNLDLLTESLRMNGINYADLLPAFENERKNGIILYHRLDSHWNARGAALAFGKITDALGIKAYNWYDSAYEIKQVHEGDLYKMLFPAGSEMDDDAVFEKKFGFTYPGKNNSDYYGENAPRSDNQRIVTASSTGSGRLLMFRDSFGNSLYPFMADTFKEAVFMRAMPYQMDLLDSGEFDYAVFEIVERNIKWLAERAPVMKAPTAELYTNPLDSYIGASAAVSDSEALPGYSLVTGTYDGDLCDIHTKIFLQTETGIYEACPAADSSAEYTTDANFTAYIPQRSIEQLYIIAEKDGILVRQPLILQT